MSDPEAFQVDSRLEEHKNKLTHHYMQKHRDPFLKYLFYFSRDQPFFFISRRQYFSVKHMKQCHFSGERFVCLSNRWLFFQKAFSVCQTMLLFRKMICLFIEYMLFSRRPCLFVEHVPFCRNPWLFVCSNII